MSNGAHLRHQHFERRSTFSFKTFVFQQYVDIIIIINNYLFEILQFIKYFYHHFGWEGRYFSVGSVAKIQARRYGYISLYN